MDLFPADVTGQSFGRFCLLFSALTLSGKGTVLVSTSGEHEGDFTDLKIQLDANEGFHFQLSSNGSECLNGLCCAAQCARAAQRAYSRDSKPFEEGLELLCEPT